MKCVLANHEGRPRRVVNAVLHYELGILRGLTRSHFGYVALLAIVFGVTRAVQVRGSLHSVASYWLPLYAVSGFLVLLFAAVIVNTVPRIPRPAALGLAVVAGCALALPVTRWLLSLPIAPSSGSSFHNLRTVVTQWGLVAAAYYFIERAARRAAELREAELEWHRTEAQLLEARLQVMQAQVEPHFLFNTLAHVQQLYHIDPARGRSMLDSFCDYLCAALPQMRGSCSTLGREVELSRAYLETQRIRMGRRLQLEIAIPEELLAAAFPPMMMLSLVENAIKHGLNPLRAGGSIRIAAASGDGVLRVTVADTGAGFSRVGPEFGHGVGLSNIRSRLAALHGVRGRLTLCRNRPHGVLAAIDVPLHKDRGDASERERARVSQTAANSRPIGTPA